MPPRAVSADGQWIAQAEADPPALAILGADGRVAWRHPAGSLDGRVTSPVAQVFDCGPRRSFVVSFEALPQLWEVSTDPAAQPIFDGLVHDYRMGEAIARSGFLGVRRTPLDAPFTIVAVDAAGRHVLGHARGGPAQALEVIHLDVRRVIARRRESPQRFELSAADGKSTVRVRATGPEIVFVFP